MASVKNLDFERIPFLIAARPELDYSQQDTPLPLQQHPFYAAAMQSLGANIDIVTVRDDGNEIMRGYTISRSFLKYITVSSILRGPMWRIDTLDNETKVIALKFLRDQFSNWRWRFLSVMPEMEDRAENKKLMRAAGFKQIITGTSTMWLDLSLSEEELINQLDSNWRNQLKKAKAENFSISFGGSKAKHYNWLLEMEKDQQNTKGYHALPLDFVPAYDQARRTLKYGRQNILSTSAIEKGAKIAGALFLLHGNSATYHIGWAGDRARSLNAQNRVLFESMLALKDHGIRWLDIGGLDTGPNAGIARFKLGLGARAITLVGTYI